MEEEKKDLDQKRRNFFKNVFKSEKDQIVVGGPRNFRHTSHIGWGQDGFSITDIPNEWKDIFKKAGIKKNELENKETAQKIISIITDVMYAQGTSSGSSQPTESTPQNNDNNTNSPPPPPSKTSPPPPPPMMNAPPPPRMGGPPPPRMGGQPSNTYSEEDLGSSGSNNLLEELQKKSNTLSKEREGKDIPDIKNMSQNQQTTLVDTLSLAMKQIRVDIEDSRDDEDGRWTDSEEN